MLVLTMRGRNCNNKRTESSFVSKDIINELLTCGSLDDQGYGCGRRMKKRYTGRNAIWACPKCGERMPSLLDSEVQNMIQRLEKIEKKED